MSTTTVVVGGARPLSHTPQTRRRDVRGYASSRQAYDKRRRRFKLTDEDRTYKLILRADPCAAPGCSHVVTGEANAIDHIVPLDVGGEHAWTNFTVLCRACNAQKKNTDLLRWLHDRQ